MILGDQELPGTDAEYGPVRLLEGHDVEDIAAALADVDDAVLRERFDAAA